MIFSLNLIILFKYRFFFLCMCECDIKFAITQKRLDSRRKRLQFENLICIEMNKKNKCK